MKKRFSSSVLLVCATIACSLPSCKKTDPGPSGTDHSAPLLSESSGWHRIGYVNNTGTFIDQAQPASMTAFDLQVTPSLNSIQLIYSEDKLEPFYPVSNYYKASFIIGRPVDSVVHYLLPQPFAFAAAPPDELAHRFLFTPGTFTVNDLLFYHYFNRTYYNFDVHNEQTALVTTQGTFYKAYGPTKLLPSGDIISGDVNVSEICELNYYHAAAHAWDHLNQSAGDTQFAITYTPFKLDDGSLLGWRMWAKAGHSYISVDDYNFAASFPASPFVPRFTEEHAEYAPNGIKPGFLYTPVYPGTATVVAYTTQGTSVTVVVAYQNNTTHAYTLSAFKWTKGTTALQRLYGGVPISAATGDMLTTHRDQVGCTPEGTAYALIYNGASHYYLSLTDAAGERSVGDVANNSSSRQSVTMSCLRYLAGSYYAVATPNFTGVDGEGQHLDVVKITP